MKSILIVYNDSVDALISRIMSIEDLEVLSKPDTSLQTISMTCKYQNEIFTFIICTPTNELLIRQISSAQGKTYLCTKLAYLAVPIEE